MAALLSVLAYYDIDARLDTLSRQLRTTASYGTHYRDIVRVAEGYGLQPAVAFNMTTADLIATLKRGVPVLLAIQAWSEKGDPRDVKAWSSRFDDGHYVVAIGYDDTRIYFDDPAMFRIGYITFQELDARWHDRDGRQVLEHFGIAISGGRHAAVSRSAYAPID